MGFDRTQTFSIEPVYKITLKSPSLFLSVFAENITTLKPETTPEEHSRWVREGLALRRSIEDFGERVFLAWCEWDHGQRDWGREKRLKMEAADGSPEAGELLQGRGGPRVILWMAPPQPDRAAGTSSFLLFAPQLRHSNHSCFWLHWCHGPHLAPTGSLVPGPEEMEA